MRIQHQIGIMKEFTNIENPYFEMNVVLRLGGMHEFQKTGVYPMYILVISHRHHRTWRIKIKESESREGKLYLKKEAVYNYKYLNSNFSYQRIENGGIVTDWLDVVNIVTELWD